MSKWAEWTESELMHLGFLIQGGFTNPEISKIMGKPRTGVAIKAQRIWGGNPNYRKSITKHAHLREPVMRYFLKHSWEETKEKFGLTQSELKSLFTVGYRDQNLKHLRKDKRVKREWDTKDYLTLLRFAGLKQRTWISKKLKRGGVHSTRERLEKLGIASKNLQGITLSQYRQAFGAEPERYIQSEAGPNRSGMPTRFKIILWSDLDRWLKRGKIHAPDVFKVHCSAMAMFQNWVWQGYERIGA